MPLTRYQWILERYHQAIDAGVFANESVENVTLTYDLTVKRLTHADAGIAEYWAVNLNTKELNVF